VRPWTVNLIIVLEKAPGGLTRASGFVGSTIESLKLLLGSGVNTLVW